MSYSVFVKQNYNPTVQEIVVLCAVSCLPRILLLTTLVFVIGNNNKTDRRGFFKKLRDNYVAGRLEAATTKEEKRILERKQSEKIRRRAVFERNVKTLVDGFSRRLRRGPGHIKLLVVGGVVLVIWLCHKGSIGCERDRRDKVLVIGLGVE